MRRCRPTSRGVLPGVLALLLGSCTDDRGKAADSLPAAGRDTGAGPDADDGDDDGDDGDDGDVDDGTTWEDARPIIEQRCARCHSADRLSTYRRLTTHAEVYALRSSILDKLSAAPPRGLRMPVAANHESAAGCTPTHAATNDKRLTADEADVLTAYLERTDHLEADDPHAPLTAPERARLADAETYVSTQYDVINDGFLEAPDGGSDEYMEDVDYDEREYDQMEDDWICVRFDPARVDPGYLTAVQAWTESGQIFLNAQLVVDTTGESAAAQAAADRSGTDWYGCDAGLGFSDAVPLWRFVPGDTPVELPEGVGLRFEPGWTFVLRADLHTHYDRAEFERLDQNGEIDEAAGTMTWFDRATLQAQWAAPADIDRELRWLAVGPQTSAERAAFRVDPGESQLQFTTAVPGAPGTRFSVFSAELGMGKTGTAATLSAPATDTCVVSNTDFSPKWIEEATYAADDAPALDAGALLDLSCHYRSAEDAPLEWGAEGEATVWARRERCQAVVHYYEQ